MMQILFTKSDYILSKVIRYLTGEPISHCAILYKNWIVQSNLLGVRAIALDEFEKHSEIIYKVEVESDAEHLLYLLAGYGRARYDLGGLLYLGLRAIFPFLPKANLWQSTGMFLCTELVTQFISGSEQSDLTPMQLYKLLENK